MFYVYYVVYVIFVGVVFDGVVEVFEFIWCVLFEVFVVEGYFVGL